MESQNVSAQLYFKQLANIEGNADSDASIENTFQKQLDLSEYYKSKYVFESMKKDYMDKTMEGSEAPYPDVPVAKQMTPNLVPTEIKVPVGPRDFLNKKSTFGATSSNNNNNLMYILLFIFLLCIAFKMKFI